MQKNEGLGTPHSMYRDVLNSLVSYTAKDDGTLSAIFRFNGALDIFAGHFPGNPMLPGVLQLEMIRLMMEKKYAAGLRIDYIQKVKFLEPIFPDESIKVHIKSDRKDKPLFIDCTLIVKEKTAAKLKIYLIDKISCSIVNSPGILPGIMEKRLDYPDVKSLIPHRDPFIMIDGILFDDNADIHVKKTFPDNHYGAWNGEVLESALIEMAAQAVAAKDGLDALREKRKPDMGMLVSITKFKFNLPVKTNQPVEVHAEKTTSVGPFYIMKIMIFQNRETVAEGGIQLHVAPLKSI